MGAIDRLRGLLVYLDANIIISIVEGYPAHRPVLRDLVQALDDGVFSAVTSELTLAEVLVGPFRAPNRRYEAIYSAILKCDLFLTNDQRLQAPAGLTVITLAELALA